MREFVRVVPIQQSRDEHHMMKRRLKVAPRFWLPSEFAVA
jgi:hypothetical protein